MDHDASWLAQLLGDATMQSRLPYFPTLGFTTAFIAVALICHMVTLSMIVGVLCAQGVFGLAAGIIAWRTQGIGSAVFGMHSTIVVFIIAWAPSPRVLHLQSSFHGRLCVLNWLLPASWLASHFCLRIWVGYKEHAARKEINIVKALHKHCKGDLKLSLNNG